MNSRRAERPLIALVANSSFNIVNFRLELIRHLKSAGYGVMVLAPDARSAMASHDVAADDWPIDRSGLNPFRDLVTLWRLRSRFASSNVSAVLSFTVKPNVYGALASRLLGIPAVPNVSGLGTAFISGGMLGQLVTSLCRVAFSRCPAVMFQNPDDLELFVARRIVDRGQARLLPGSGIDLDKFRPTPLPEGPPTFLLIARLLRDKGICEFVEAAGQLKLEHPEWRFQLLGPLDSENRTGLRKADLDQWTDQGAIEYLGEASDVRPAIAAATALVLPSYREGLPRTLLEGAAMGRPLVATDVPGCRELVIEEVTGFRCAPRDPLSLAAAMRRIGTLPRSKQSAMGQAARQLVEEKFSIERVNQIYLDVLSEILTNKEEVY